ncbi:MAG: SPASM domain-containing protein, partial [Candidatus Latescibacteria bacterium]|nr:SPASM domain-containing protein [Candidatus Latescibacterota bacterium]
VRMPRMDLGEKVVALLDEAMRYPDVMDILDREYKEPFNTCPFMKTGSVAIRWDGGVSPCLPLLHSHVNFKGDEEHRYRECLFGSLRDQGLLEIWKQPKYIAFRKRVTQFDFPPCVSCGTCELAGSNEEDCLGNSFPTCGGCLWAQGFILCP